MMDWKTLIEACVTKGARISFQISLFCTFLYFFGLPAIEKYRREDIMVVEKTKFTNGIPVPAITIAVADQINFDFESCTDLNASSIDNCIDANSKHWSQILKGVAFSLWALSENTRVATEQLVYPVSSLIAEFGGTLSLFLGVSFVTIWDNFCLFSVIYRIVIKKTKS